MKKIIEFIKKYWLFILLAAVVTILLALRLNLKKPIPSPPGPVPTPTLGSLPQPQSDFAEILGEGPYYNILLSESNFARFLQTLPVYRIKKFSKEEILSQLSETIAGLGFSGQPTEERRKDSLYLIWREEENYLKVNIETGQFSFVGKASLGQAQTITSSQIKSLVEETLVSWNLISPGLKAERIEGFVPVGQELSPITDINKAVFFKVFFNPLFNNYPLIGVGPAKELIEVTIDNNGVLASLSFNLHQVNKEAVDNYPTKTFEETVKTLKEGKGQIIEVLTSEQEERSIPSRDQIQEIKISTVSIAYYETTETQEYYQPIFLLKGSLTLKNEETYQASFILPAISSEYLKPPQEHFRL